MSSFVLAEPDSWSNSKDKILIIDTSWDNWDNTFFVIRNVKCIWQRAHIYTIYNKFLLHSQRKDIKGSPGLNTWQKAEKSQINNHTMNIK